MTPYSLFGHYLELILGYSRISERLLSSQYDVAVPQNYALCFSRLACVLFLDVLDDLAQALQLVFERGDVVVVSIHSFLHLFRLFAV